MDSPSAKAGRQDRDVQLIDNRSCDVVNPINMQPQATATEPRVGLVASSVSSSHCVAREGGAPPNPLRPLSFHSGFNEISGFGGASPSRRGIRWMP